jgi:hypothetical protein
MTCAKCQDLCVRYEIRSPKDLGKALTIAKQNVDDGTVSEIVDKNPLGLPPFGSLRPNGPWDDLIAYRFRCTDCGELFSLNAETYHGQGGAWEPERRAAIR